jgi:hypothetical protein
MAFCFSCLAPAILKDARTLDPLFLSSQMIPDCDWLQTDSCVTEKDGGLKWSASFRFPNNDLQQQILRANAFYFQTRLGKNHDDAIPNRPSRRFRMGNMYSVDVPRHRHT